MNVPVPSEHAIYRYVAKIDASASHHDAANAIRKLFLAAKRQSSDSESARYVAHGVVLIVTLDPRTVTTVFPEPRAGTPETIAPALIEDLRKQSRFVVIEGIDGVGKTTLIANLASVMPKSTLFLRCNRDTEPGVCARNLIAHGHHDYAIQAAMIADKFVLDRTIRAARAEGRTVVIDRWTYSALAYAPRLRPWLAQAYSQVDNPTHVLLLELPVSNALKRLGARGETDALETRPRLAEAKLFYEQTAEKHGWHRADATATEEQLVSWALEAMETR